MACLRSPCLCSYSDGSRHKQETHTSLKTIARICNHNALSWLLRASSLAVGLVRIKYLVRFIRDHMLLTGRLAAGGPIPLKVIKYLKKGWWDSLRGEWRQVFCCHSRAPAAESHPGFDTCTNTQLCHYHAVGSNLHQAGFKQL
ncbi:unnamed protein product [Pleuronectes platessa]|uniref:Uncharacterized protein n=1 Tax=Pleuronectes platessa TaxID=8262 RepID=A0A9N7U2A8_PLEPL|nr:unnamed protein product [Pleuronectes platessa]